MKYLSEYIEEEQSKAFKDHYAFFAFSQSQLTERQLLCIKQYVSIGAGLIAPKCMALPLINKLAEITAKGIQQDISDNGIVAIVRRELDNHEYSYTMDTTDTIEALSEYPVTAEQIERIARNKRLTQGDFDNAIN